MSSGPGLTRADVAKHFDVSVTAVAKWEHKGFIAPAGIHRGVAFFDAEQIEEFDPNDPPPEIEGGSFGSAEQQILKILADENKELRKHLAEVLKTTLSPTKDILTVYGETVRASTTAAQKAQDKVAEVWDEHLKGTTEIEKLKLEFEKDEKSEARKDELLAMFKNHFPMALERLGASKMVEVMSKHPEAGKLFHLIQSLTEEQLGILSESGILQSEQIELIHKMKVGPPPGTQQPAGETSAGETKETDDEKEKDDTGDS